MPGVKRERDDSIVVLTLDEPETLNAMTPDLLGDLAIAIGEINDDPQVRALVLTGAGRGFCSGQNLKATQILGDDIAAGVMKYYWPAFTALRDAILPSGEELAWRALPWQSELGTALAEEFLARGAARLAG